MGVWPNISLTLPVGFKRGFHVRAQIFFLHCLTSAQIFCAAHLIFVQNAKNVHNTFK